MEADSILSRGSLSLNLVEHKVRKTWDTTIMSGSFFIFKPAVPRLLE